MQPRHFLYWLPSKDIVSPQVKEYLRALSPCGALVSLRQVFNFSLQPFAFGGHIKQALRGARSRLPGKAYIILFRSICQAPGSKKLFRLVLSCASSRRLYCPRPCADRRPCARFGHAAAPQPGPGMGKAGLIGPGRRCAAAVAGAGQAAADRAGAAARLIGAAARLPAPQAGADRAGRR